MVVHNRLKVARMKVNSSLSDRFFKKAEKHKLALSAIGVFTLIISFYFRKELDEGIEPYKGFLKLLALILGPFATLVGFYLGYKSKVELVRHTAESENLLTKHAKDLSAESRKNGALGEQLRASAAELQEQDAKIRAQTEELSAQEQRVQTLNSNLRRVTDGGHNLWKAHEPNPFSEYYSWLRAPDGAKIITIGNLKGGVGKTTIAANLAAYVSQKREKPVLVIDLDYQGSLSNMMMFAAGEEEIPSNVDLLFSQDATLETLDQSIVHIAKVLPRAWLIPASYTFGSIEGKFLLNWLMNPDQSIDARYKLARLLLNPSVRKRYSAIILDMPPRLTLGSVNALVASHYLIVPSALDKMSTEALRQFLEVGKAIKNDMGLDIDLLGAIGTLSRQQDLGKTEQLAWNRIGEHCNLVWQKDKEYRFKRTIPRKEKIAEAAGEAIAYISAGKEVQQIFDALGDEVWARMMGTGAPELATAAAGSPQSGHTPASERSSESD
jgi:cellulose biosynthesis protein BcsQ